jgi:arylsulfatase A-like enzyme
MRLVIVSLVLCLAATVSLATVSLAAENQPNIVFIFSDDHACQAVGCYGSVVNETPHIDRLARMGMRFDRCLVTNSICGPSRAVIQTGKYSHINGFFHNGNRFDGSQQTFPKLLRAAGYQTAVIGKWHLVTEPQGFDYWRVLPDQGRYYSPVFLTPEGREVVPGYATDVTTNMGLEWLASGRDTSKPFMLMLQHKAPHREWQPGPDHVGKFRDVQLPEPATLLDDHSGLTDAAKRATMRVYEDMRDVQDLKVFDATTPYGKQLFSLMSPAEQAAWRAAYDEENAEFLANKPIGEDRVRWNCQRYIKDYVNTVASVDDSVGRVLDYLEANGLADNTIVIYSSDQGFYLGEHGWYDKRFIYEESLRTPLVVHWPGVTEPGSVNKQIVSNLDFAPTLLAAAGVEVPDDMQGRSLAPLLAGESVDDWRTDFYYHYYEGPPAVHTVERHYGIVTDRFKLVHFYDLDQWELLDREQDPHEVTNFYGDPSYAEVQAQLAERLVELRQQFDVRTNEAVRNKTGPANR